uniref:Uncharacterized protein n=1 Tax=Sphaerodactylus townsendi TaxID=933632 RepID=A0ACB8G2K3_9SAUR
MPTSLADLTACFAYNHHWRAFSLYVTSMLTLHRTTVLQSVVSFEVFDHWYQGICSLDTLSTTLLSFPSSTGQVGNTLAAIPGVTLSPQSAAAVALLFPMSLNNTRGLGTNKRNSWYRSSPSQH